MPQEIVVPLVRVSTLTGAKKEKSKVEKVGVQLLGTNHKITTSKFRFEFIQTKQTHIQPIWILKTHSCCLCHLLSRCITCSLILSVHSSPLTRWPTRPPPTSCATTHPGRSRWHGHDPARPWSCCGGAHLARALSAACGATRTPTGTARALAHGRRSSIPLALRCASQTR